MILELARTGLANNGQDLTLDILKDADKNFKDSRPVVIGHPKNDPTKSPPKYGDVNEAGLVGNTLIGDVGLIPEVQKLFDKGLYNKWSCRFKKNPATGWYLYDLGLLGGEPPAIPGLEVLNYSDGETAEDTIEYIFSDSTNEKKDPGENLEIQSNKKENTDNMDKDKEIADLKAQLAAKNNVENENAQLKTQVKDLNENNKTFSDSLASYKKQSHEAKKNSLKTALEGKVPKEKLMVLMEFSDLMEECETYEFSDKTNKDFFDVVKDVFGNLPALAPTGESGMDFSDPQGAAAGIKTSELVKKL